jgi:hypothetical protein
VTLLPFDPEHPPARAPDNAHPTLWGMAYVIHSSHQADPDGFCVLCREPRERTPCAAARIAQRGFLLAVELAR